MNGTLAFFASPLLQIQIPGNGQQVGLQRRRSDFSLGSPQAQKYFRRDVSGVRPSSAEVEHKLEDVPRVLPVHFVE